MVRRVVLVAVLTGALAPVTGAGLLLAFAYIWFGAVVPLDIYTRYFQSLVVGFMISGAAPAALFAGVGLSMLAGLRAGGLPPPALLLLGGVLGAGCGLLVPVTIASLGGRPLPWPWGLAAAFNGAMWGSLVAQCASTAAGERRST